MEERDSLQSERVAPRWIFPTFHPPLPPLGRRATRVRLAACVHTIFRYSCYKLFIEFPLSAAVVDAVGLYTVGKYKAYAFLI